MEFTYNAFRSLIRVLKGNNYQFCGYDNYQDKDKVVIMRHDIDFSLDQAVKLAKVEREEGISSVYFALLSTNFYNLASKESLEKVNKILECGHSIGLHFDEVKYNNSSVSIVEAISKEAEIMGKIIGFPITSVSMHRPPKATLKADYSIDGIINSYSEEFFKGFKYVSDSRRRWRENVEEIIEQSNYKRLHILTHPFWYNECEESITDTVKNFINTGNNDRYLSMKENITDIDSILRGER